MSTATAGTLSKKNSIYTIAVIGFIFTLHAVIPMYSNSSFLSLFADETTLGYIYMASAAVSILSFLFAPSFIRRLGNYETALVLITFQVAVYFGLIFSTSPIVLASLFILGYANVALISLTLDIFLEAYTESSQAGAVRGFYNATLNASWLVGPLIGGMLINGTNNYRNTYVAAMMMLFPLIYLIYRNFPRFKDPHYAHLSPLELVSHVASNRNWMYLFSANLILQIFYAWMVVYSPIYLNKVMGFSWEAIGAILVIMLVPFPLVQFPLGRLADRKYGEKEMMAMGFGILGVSTILLSFISIPSLVIWAFMLFLTRVGAATAEIMLETYFFKTVPSRDTAALGMFRITRPLAYFIAPIVTMISLAFTSDSYLFIIIGIIALLAIYPSLRIKDTR